MRVKFLKAKSKVIDRLTTKNWPVDWSGTVDAAILSEWTEGEDYVLLPVSDTPAAAPPLTPVQTAVLAAAADEIIRMSEAPAAAPVAESVETPPAARKPARAARAAGSKGK